MVISLLKSGGVKCQASGFSLMVDPVLSGGETASPEEGRGKLALRTEAPGGMDFPASGGVIAIPGEYEVSGVIVRGIPLPEESSADKLRTIYLVDMDGIRLCFLGPLTKELKDESLEKLEGVQVLLLPIGSPYLSVRQAINLIKQIEPKLVIPTAVKDKKSLLEEFGGKAEVEEKITLKAKDLEEEGIKLIWLKEK
ncbi:MAG: MBL fold metallo-hydrolase [Candidatus Colwellbacteria bacterium]|nr:MBL fold metallo-hydrolase [Candidatus Colwellbacteria bacterium]